MARDFSARTDIDNTNPADFPDGRIRDSNPPAARNGTRITEAVLGDMFQIFLKLLRDAGITPNGNADTDSNSQYLQALVAKIRETTASTTQNGTVELATNTEVNNGTAGRVVTADGLNQRAATTALTGLVELATNAEVQTGSDTLRAVTPAGLASLIASTNQRGLVEIATTAEVEAGTDLNRVVVAGRLGARTATQTRSGVAEIATQAEVNSATDDSRIVTPLKLNTTLGQSTQVVINDNSTIIRTKTVVIPAWNMQTTSTLDIAHGITLGNVISVVGNIRNDANNIRYGISQGANTGAGQPDLFIFRIDSANVRLQRNSTGQFNDASFSGTGFNRGILQITYS